MQFEILARDAGARLGRLETAHGTIDTPAFMPVGTLGAVKGLTPQELEAAGAQVMLANLTSLAAPGHRHDLARRRHSPIHRLEPSDSHR
jgi:queuine tRNA-ribosyltransferase